MARYSRGWRTSGAGSTTLPIASLYATAAVRPRVVEIGCFNTTATAVNVGVARLTTAGTASSLSPIGVYEDDNSQAAVAVAKDTHSSTGPTIGAPMRAARLPSDGAGIVWTFGSGKTPGLVVPNTTGDAVAIIIASGTGQICDVWFVWDE
jgi:hypothetical protein